MSAIRFSRRPYTVTYMKDGERQTIRRRPPPKLHDVWPKDLVSLKETKNIDWEADDEFTVKHINPRHPNVLQLINDEGETTFVDHYQVELEEMIGERDGVKPQEMEVNNKYLLWP